MPTKMHNGWVCFVDSLQYIRSLRGPPTFKTYRISMLLHAILTRAFAVTAPAAPVTLVNAAGVNINDYLLALRQVPEPVLAAFNAAGWTYRIDFDYISELSKQLNMSCIGATNYSQKTIYLSEASATLHEFGHFLDWTLGILSLIHI